MLARAVARQVIDAIKQTQLVCGVDEAGRDCFFEPVVYCALVVNSNKHKNFQLIENSVEEPIMFEVTSSQLAK